MRDFTINKDPVFLRKNHPHLIDRIFLRYLDDERDLPMVYLCLRITFIVIPSAIILFTEFFQGWQWYAAAGIYLIMVAGYFMGPYVLMLHNTSHRVLFKRKYRLGNLYIPWILGPFFGQSPDTYFGHHVGMHHVENNLEDDISSTMHYQRDSLKSFLFYYSEFIFIGFVELVNYFRFRRRNKLLKKVIRGEFSFFLLCVLLCFINWQATLFVFIIPFVIVRFAMMAGNWGQHAFIDAATPENNYRNSITCINSVYNRRCFNDGYHIGHHLSPRMHWTEMASDFCANRQHYAEQHAIVFEGIDFFGVWLMLMMKRYDLLAKCFVNIGQVHHSEEELIRFLKSRTRKIDTPHQVN
ncbi:MAG: fatty acid desaturase [Chitinophagales bacterium]